MSQNYRDVFNPYSPYQPTPPAPTRAPEHWGPSFADLLDLVRRPKGILSEEEHFTLRNHVRAILSLPPIEEEDDEDLEEAEVVQ